MIPFCKTYPVEIFFANSSDMQEWLICNDNAIRVGVAMMHPSGRGHVVLNVESGPHWDVSLRQLKDDDLIVEMGCV